MEHQQQRRETVSLRDNCSCSWSDLPEELLYEIGKRHKTQVDIIRFRSVCTRWRKSLPLPASSGTLSPILPYQVPNPEAFFNNDSRREPLALVASAVFVIDTIPPSNNTDPWMLTVEERERGKLTLLYPLSKEPAVTTNLFPKYLDLSKFRVTEVSRSYRFIYTRQTSGCYDADMVDSVVLLPNYDPTALISDCTAVVAFMSGVVMGVSLGDGECRCRYMLDSSRTTYSYFNNVFLHGGVVCLVTDDYSSICEIDHDTMEVRRTFACKEELISVDWRRCRTRFVEMEGELLMICWVWPGEFDLKRADDLHVYKLNELTVKWEYMNNFGNKMLLLSFRWCFLIPSRYLHSTQRKTRTKSLFLGELKDLDIHMLITCEECPTSDNSPSLPDAFENRVARMMWPPPPWFYIDGSPSG